MNPFSELFRKGTKLARIARYPSAIGALRYGVAAAVEHEAFLKLINPKIIVDVGANTGQFSLIASAIHPKTRIVAFEPIPRAAGIFQSVFSGNALVELRRLALGADACEAALHVAARDDSSSLLPASKRQISVSAKSAKVDQISVSVRKLSEQFTSNELSEGALLKIDVQGFELEVIKGAKPLLIAFSDIYVELSFVELYVGQPLCDSIISFLLESGFRLSGIFNIVPNTAGAPLQADFHFSRRPEI